MAHSIHSMLGKRLTGALACVASLAFSVSASAVDPVTAGNTNIGKHPTYPDQFSGFWRTGVDYTLLSDTQATYLNAPSANGQVSLSVGNTGAFSVSSQGAYFWSGRVLNSSVGFASINSELFSAVMRIGTHPSYGPKYAGVWLELPNCGNCPSRDYTLLADSENTFLNANHPTRGMLYFRAANADLMTISKDSGLRLRLGRAYKPGGGAWEADSDARVKKDVADFTDGLSAIEKIRPVSFRYNGLGGTENSPKQYVGVIAQELEKTLPFMVSVDPKKLRPEDKKDTDLKVVDPSAFNYVLINAVKQLSAQNKEMAAENKQMKRLICADHPKESFCSKASTN